MFRNKPTSRAVGLAACAAVVCTLLGTAVVAQQQAPAGGYTYTPGSFYPPYYGGGGFGGGGYGGYGGWGWGGYGGVGSTAAGSYMTGMGNAIRAQGQYNLDTSAAAINATEAERRQIENSKLWTQTYFEKRRINQAYRESQKRPPGDEATWMRLAQAGTPDRLSPSTLDPVTGRITWPPGLMGQMFAPGRDQLDRLFADRALSHGAIGVQTHGEIRGTIDNMLALLKSHIRDFGTNQYVDSKNFLESLAFEASAPTPGGYAPTAARDTPPPPR